MTDLITDVEPQSAPSNELLFLRDREDFELAHEVEGGDGAVGGAAVRLHARALREAAVVAQTFDDEVHGSVAIDA